MELEKTEDEGMAEKVEEKHNLIQDITPAGLTKIKHTTRLLCESMNNGTLTKPGVIYYATSLLNYAVNSDSGKGLDTME